MALWADKRLVSAPTTGIYLIGLTWHVLLSSITFVVYWRDKVAARSQLWRTRESTLQVLALLGGWPGALLAQMALRHKSRKTGFLIIFYLMAATNIAFEGWLVLAVFGAAG